MKKLMFVVLFLILILSGCNTNPDVNEVGNKKLKINEIYNDETREIEVTEGEKLQLPEKEIPGYVLDGFYFEDGTNIKDAYYYESFGQTVTAKYKPTTYKLTYKYFDETMEYSLSYLDEIPQFTPNVEGYEFIGWKDYKILFPNNKYSQTKDVVLEANFLGEEHTITYLVKGEIYNVQHVRYMENYELNTNKPIEDGYRFVEWKCQDASFIKEETYKYQKDLVFDAVYEKDVYHINYYVDEKLEYSQEVKYLSDFEIYTPKEKANYKFDCWLLNEEKFEKSNYDLKEDINLYASFILDAKVNYVTLDGSLIGEEKMENGLLKLKSASLAGYNFNGWYTDPYYNNQIENLDLSTYNAEPLYARYTLDDSDLKATISFSRYNDMTTKYDEVSVYSGDKTSITSLYWKKYTLVKNGDKYIVSAIADSGTSLSKMGSFTYLIEAFTNFNGYSDFCKLNIEVGDEAIFASDPTLHQDGSVYNIISFVKRDVTPFKDEIKTYLKNLYDSYLLIESDLDLVKSYNDFAIKWVSSNTSALSNDGKYLKPKDDQDITLKAYVGDVEVYSTSLKIKGSGQAKYLSTGYVYTNYGNLTQFALNNLDIIYPSFLNINSSADWVNLTSAMNKIENYIRAKANNSGTKIVVSINQENNSGAFSSVASSEELRKKFAANICEVVQKYHLDGIDIDWETPSSTEKGNFTLMMKEIYTSLKAINKDYLVTAAIGGGKWAPPKYDLPNSIQYLDYVNLMTYSMCSGNSYYQNALYKSTHGATLVSCSIDESITIYDENKVPREKILVGIPFYCVLQTGSEGYGSKVGTGKSISYSSFLNNYKSLETMVEYFDEECGVPYCYDATNKYFVSYDNERSIMLKSQYIHEKGLAGLMFWQYGQDVNDYFMTCISKYLNA